MYWTRLSHHWTSGSEEERAGAREPFQLLLPPLIGEWGVYFAEVLAWGGAAVLLLIGYHQRVRKLEGRLGIQDSAR